MTKDVTSPSEDAPSILVAPSKHLSYKYLVLFRFGVGQNRVMNIWTGYFCNIFLAICEEYSQHEDVTIITYKIVTMSHNGAGTSKSDILLLET